jgi:hypothetical protein
MFDRKLSEAILFWFTVNYRWLSWQIQRTRDMRGVAKTNIASVAVTPRLHSAIKAIAYREPCKVALYWRRRR